ncbi:peptidyl-prolyl cis-trans isomerase FKBP4 [Nephila pilipes]|uniref:peptidylprolyl isomerase n=1 Tax=Nephila pilipes TaxID=299642 RepID=A0A8X6NDJ1_NEPPI|nr:peptidyl-prolyl cis-trans isomerase FKBP4 [Nephila pilipes]
MAEKKFSVSQDPNNGVCIVKLKLEHDDHSKSGKEKRDYMLKHRKIAMKYKKKVGKGSSSVVEMEEIMEDGGVKKQVMKAGKGDDSPKVGDKVVIHYTGWLLDGNTTLYETNRSDEKFEFSLGMGTVMKGWDIGIASMKKGEVALFIIQPQYAYGAKGNPPKVPPNMSLMFEIELYDWELEDISPTKSGKILRRIIENGEGTIFPDEGFEITVKYTGYYKDCIFEECVKQFPLGDGICAEIPESIEEALYRFRLKEKSMLFMSGRYGYKPGSPQFKIPPGADIKYEVTLLNFEKVKEVFEMNTDEKLARARLVKERGITLFKVGHYKSALKQFKHILSCLENEPGADPDTKEVRTELLKSAYLNISLCHLKTEHYSECIRYCTKVLEMDPVNEKALFRRGQANMHFNECNEAMKDFHKLKELYPENQATKKSMYTCLEKMKADNLKEKNTYNNMFEKFMKQDQEKMKHMKTETGVWEDGQGCSVEECKSETQRLIERNDDLLRDANVIELSNTAL